jgi:heme-degrading monooxygenase HmoA
MFIAMNRFQVNRGREYDFERRWRERESSLQGAPGFVAFSLLRNWLAADTIEYISHSTWSSVEAFEAWRDSEAFSRVQAQEAPAGLLAATPEVALYETVLSEARAAAQA